MKESMAKFQLGGHCQLREHQRAPLKGAHALALHIQGNSDVSSTDGLAVEERHQCMQISLSLRYQCSNSIKSIVNFRQLGVAIKPQRLGYVQHRHNRDVERSVLVVEVTGEPRTVPVVQPQNSLLCCTAEGY